jgi:4-amino-4-deoxy-L-arabinose transferase-like glycosyltransferase
MRRFLLSFKFAMVLFFALLSLLLIFHLGSKPPFLAKSEISTISHSQNINSILKKPVNAPHDIIIYVAKQVGLTKNFYYRLPSTLFALLFLFCFYSLARGWFGKTIGLLSTVIAASTPIFLITARQASPQIMLLAPLAIMAIFATLQRAKKNQSFYFYCLVICCAVFLYVPGMVWWLIGTVIICRKKIFNLLEMVPMMHIIIAALIAFILLVPLAVALVNDWTIIKSLALIPSHMAAPLDLLKNIAWMGNALFIKAPYTDNLILGRLAMLNIIQVAFLLFGSFALWTVAKTKLLALLGAILLAILLAGINNQLNYLLLGLGSAWVIIGAGLRYLYIEWRSVFPRNPLARYLAITLMSLVVIVNLLFGMRYSLIAWPHTIVTKNSNVIK